jgi:hypothetical protein
MVGFASIGIRPPVSVRAQMICAPQVLQVLTAARYH